MRFKKKFLVLPIALMTLSSCEMLQGLEEEITVVFEYNNEIIYSDYTTQFRNVLMPTLSEEQIPVHHEFYGWTWLNPDSVSIKDADFAEKYFEKDGVIHLADVKDYAFNSTVTLHPVFVLEDDIPIPNYYIAIGWYGKTSTSGLDQARVDAWTIDLKEFLKAEGATDEDLNNIVINKYEGDVATAGSLINKDRYIDVLIGFGKNIGSTGGVEYIDNIGGIIMGGKERYITQLTEKETAVKVFNWLQTPEGNASLA